jgi:hypothetical protein
MSNEDLLKLKAKDPFMALRLIIESNIPSSFPSPGYPKEFNPHYFESAHDGLVQQLQEKILNVDLFHVLEKDSNHGLGLIALVKNLSNSQESTTNASLLVFLVEFAPLLEQITQLLYDKQQLTQKIVEHRNLRLHHLERYDSVARETLSINTSGKESNEVVQSKALKAIEHYELAIKLGQDVTCSTLEKEFVEVKLEICESIYEKLKANLKL